MLSAALQRKAVVECSSGFQQYESVLPPDALRVLDHLAQHLVVHVDLGVDVELVVLQETALLGVSLPHLNTKPD